MKFLTALQALTRSANDNSDHVATTEYVDTAISGVSAGSGSVWRNGSGVPSNALGADGDYYLNDDNGDYYAKSGGVYTLEGNLEGPQGIQGDTGATGATGPQGIQGNNGNDGLGWTGGSYDSGTGIVTFASDDGLGFSTGDLRGAQGPTGATGPQGAPGNDGADGTVITNSADLAAAVGDETGTGVVVFSTAPTITNPDITLRNTKETTVDLGTATTTSTETLNLNDGQTAKLIVNASGFTVTLAVSNAPTGSYMARIRLTLTAGTIALGAGLTLGSESVTLVDGETYTGLIDHVLGETTYITFFKLA